MKVDAYRRCYGKSLEGEWDWQVYVWFGKGIFADVILKGRRTFDTEDECREDMERIIKKMGFKRTSQKD